MKRRFDPKKWQHHLVMTTALSCLLTTPVWAAIQPMTDHELSNAVGQALLSTGYIAPSAANNPMRNITGANNIGYYRIGLQAEMDLNANIRNLQLGCNSVNGAGCDIDIKNLALSGLPSNFDTGLGYIPSTSNNGNPTYTGDGRAATSAKLTNPFFEIAIRNPTTASTREIAGVRFSAEQIQGMLTAGLTNGNSPTTTDGIQRLSGFMRIAGTTGDVNTQSTLFGKQASHQISGLLNALGNDRTFTSDPGDADTLGITVPQMNAGFTMPAFQVNGSRQTTASVQHVTTTIAEIPLANGPNNQLRVRWSPAILFVASSAKIKLAAGSKIQNLNMDITFNQSLSMIHNIPLTGSGGYLALQSADMLWPGAYVDPTDAAKTSLATMTQSDVSKRGWWMAFDKPVQLGYLQAANLVNIDAVLPQVATLMTAELLKEGNRVYAPAGAALGTLFGITMTTPNPIIVDLNAATLAYPATLTLSNLKLVNQELTSNCYSGSGLSFC